MRNHRSAIIAITAAVLLSAGCSSGAGPGETSSGVSSGVSSGTSDGASDGASTGSASGTSTGTTETSGATSETSGATSETGGATSETATAGTTVESSNGTTAPTTVYYVQDTGTDVQLVRELRDVPTGDSAPTAAIELMIAGPADPAHVSTWNPGTRVLGVTVTPQLITVDLSADARTANVGSAGAALMIQQLVWTVTEAAGEPDAAVLLTIAGAPAGELWGVVSWTEPIGRDQTLTIGG